MNMSFPSKVADEALIACGRCCCICHEFCGLKIELHHIKMKSKGGLDSLSNCIPLCFNCHADMRSYDHKHPKGRKYSESELKRHRRAWFHAVKQQRTTIPAPVPDDEIILDAKVSWAADVDVINRIGCPSLIVTVISRSPRAAKIRNGEIRLRGFNPMEAFQAGFSTDFGYKAPAKKFQKNDAFALELIPLAKPNDAQGFVLQRDDVVRFALPLRAPFFEKLAQARSDCLGIYVELFDGEARCLGKGKTIKHALSVLSKLAGTVPYSLKVPIRMAMRLTSAGQPNLGPVGTVNSYPIVLGAPTLSIQTDRRRQLVPLCTLILNHWLMTGSRDLQVQATGETSGRTISELKKLRFRIGVQNKGAEVSLEELVGVVQFVEDQLRQLEDISGNLKPNEEPVIATVLNLDPSDQLIQKTLHKLKYIVGEDVHRLIAAC